jgi:hypothetical protein
MMCYHIFLFGALVEPITALQALGVLAVRYSPRLTFQRFASSGEPAGFAKVSWPLGPWELCKTQGTRLLTGKVQRAGPPFWQLSSEACFLGQSESSPDVVAFATYPGSSDTARFTLSRDSRRVPEPLPPTPSPLLVRGHNIAPNYKRTGDGGALSHFCRSIARL